MNQKLIQLYLKNYLPKELNFHGLKLYHELWTEDTIHWTLENPKGLSYNENVLEGYLEKNLRDFGKLIGFKPQQENYKSLSRLDIKPDYFINKSDEKKIVELGKTIKEFSFKDIKSDCKIDKISLSPGYDFWEMDVELKLLNPVRKIKSKGLIWYKNLYGEELRDEVNKMYQDEDFFIDYIYTLMSPVYIFLSNHPTLYENDYMHTSFNITIVDKEGNKY